VVNISYGGQAGPHDGSGMLERALDALLLERPDNFAIVLSAGNAKGQACHAHRVVRPDHSGLFGIQVAERDATDTFIECWYPLKDKQPQDLLRCRVRAEGGPWSAWVDAGQQAELRNARGEVVALLHHVLNPPNGDGGMVLLALAPTVTRNESADPTAPTGRWALECVLREGAAGSAVRVDAWVERDDPGAQGAGALTWLEGVDVADAEDCLSNIAGGKHTVAVGGYCRSTGISLPYSSTSPTKRDLDRLFVRAACEDSEDLPGFTAAAVRSLESHRMNGTSVAGPVLARRLYNRMVQATVSRHTMAQALKDVVKVEADAATGAAVRA
jgi:hypothetical protein